MKIKGQKEFERRMWAIVILRALSQADSQAEKLGIILALLRKIK